MHGHGADGPLPHVGEVGNRHPRRLTHLRQGIRTALWREPRRKELVEQRGKLARLLTVTSGLGDLCHHREASSFSRGLSPIASLGANPTPSYGICPAPGYVLQYMFRLALMVDPTQEGRY